MKKSWQVAGNDYWLADDTSRITVLNKGVYDLRMDPRRGLYLSKLQDEFEFDFKVYGLEATFIDRVLKTYYNTKGNMGVICNGVKGTGKTVTAKVLANKLELPIVLVGANYPGITPYLSEINQDLVVFVDEYEKIFTNVSDDYGMPDDDEGNGTPQANSTLLSIMDGAYNTQHRKVFLLTTNRKWVNENLLNRPGRVRYLKQFDDLTREQVMEIIDDCLVDQNFTESIITYLKPLKIITVDIVKAVISQVNIFNELAEKACKDLNVEFKSEEYGVYKISGKKETVVDTGLPLSNVAQVINAGGAWRGRYIYCPNEGELWLTEKPDYKNGIYTVSPSGYTSKADNFKIRIKKEASTHKIFSF